MMPEVPNIALRAYQLWDAAGRPEGRSEEFFFLLDPESPQDAAASSDCSESVYTAY
jgi:hypothetical protein